MEVNHIIKVIENENFASWAIISVFVLLFIVATIFIITRIILYKSRVIDENTTCLLYTSDAADEEDSVDLDGTRIIKKKKNRGVRRGHSLKI